MVNLKHVLAKDYQRYNLTHKSFTELAHKIPDHRKLTKEDFLKAFHKYMEERELIRRKRAEEQGENVIPVPFTAFTAPFDKRYDPFRYIINRYIEGSHDREVDLKIIYTEPKNPFIKKHYIESDKLSSDQRVILSQEINRKFLKPFYGKLGDAKRYKDDIRKTIQKITKDNEVTEQIYKDLNIIERVIRINQKILFYYVLKSGYTDCSDYVLTTFCEPEPPKIINPVTEKEFTCFINCLLRQCTDLAKTKTNIRKLGQKEKDILTFNPQGFELSDIGQIAKDFKLNITVLDTELKIVDEFKNAKEGRSKAHTFMFVIKDFHVYSINKDTKKHITAEGFHSLLQKSIKKTEVVGVNEEESLYPNFIGKCKLLYESDESEDDEIVCCTGDQLIIETFEKKKKVVFTDFEDEDKVIEIEENKNYLFFTDDSIDSLYKFYYSKGIVGSMTESINGCFQLVVQDNKSVLYFRDRNRTEYDEIFPLQYSLTIGSSTKYLFRKLMLNPEKRILPILNNPIIHRVFKGLCKPLRTSKIGEYNGYIYAFDLKKAYFNCSSDLFIPKDEIVFKEGRGVKKGACLYLTSDNKWVMSVKRGEKWKAYVETSGTTNIVRRYGEIIKEMSEVNTDYKHFFNSLIGSFHPCEATNSNIYYCHNEKDYLRFLFSGNKTVTGTKIKDDLSLFKIVFHYDLNFNNGFSLPYFSSQIIQRCNDKVMKLRNECEKLGYTVLMSIVDSCVIVSKEKIDMSKLDLNGWELKWESDKIDIKCVGNYKATKNDKTVFVTKSYTKSEGLTVDKRRELELKLVKSVEVLEEENVNTHVIVEGESGVGKSVYIRDNYFDFNCGKNIICASTGIASSSLKSRTFHSIFGIKIGEERKSSVILKGMGVKRIIKLQKCETIIIDEWTMLKKSDLDLADEILRIIMNKNMFMGGKRIVLVGDERQLLPVKGDLYSFPEGEKVERVVIPYTESSRLDKEYRDWCHFFRFDRKLDEIKKWIKRVKSKFSSNFLEDEDVLTVFYENKDVNAFNAEKRKSGLRIEEGEPLILRRNLDVKKHLYNGLRGVCKWKNGKTMMSYGEGKLLDLSDLELGKDYFLAYSVTIHKSQGLTLPGINIGWKKLKKSSTGGRISDTDLTRLIYVSLTRVRSFDRVCLF